MINCLMKLPLLYSDPCIYTFEHVLNVNHFMLNKDMLLYVNTYAYAYIEDIIEKREITHYSNSSLPTMSPIVKLSHYCIN